MTIAEICNPIAMFGKKGRFKLPAFVMARLNCRDQLKFDVSFIRKLSKLWHIYFAEHLLSIMSLSNG